MICRQTTLDNWSVVHINNSLPLEIQRPHLHGIVYGHPLHLDGNEVTTSAIDVVDGRCITTLSGTLYYLNDPEQKFVDECQKNGWHVPTKDMPIKPL